MQDAAEVLGISVDAVRMRARRGSLESEHENGRLYVWLDTDETTVRDATERIREHVQNATERELIEDLREQVGFLRTQLEQEREANRENRRLLAAALERIPPQLEAPQDVPSDQRESTVTASEEQSKGTIPPDQGDAEIRGSWWQRLFGG